MTAVQEDQHEHIHGYTRSGRPVPKRTVDHLPSDTPYQRFNKRLALIITKNIGTMSCFWLFCVISLSSLLAVMYAAHIIGTVGFLTANGFILMVSWMSQNFIQLVLLPALMVGQNLQNEAADVRRPRRSRTSKTPAGASERPSTYSTVTPRGASRPSSTPSEALCCRAIAGARAGPRGRPCGVRTDSATVSP